jgi:hypothetical protein
MVLIPPRRAPRVDSLTVLRRELGLFKKQGKIGQKTAQNDVFWRLFRMPRGANPRLNVL